MAEEGLVAPATKEEYETAGSKWVTFPPNPKVGQELTLAVEMGIPSWDTPGKSYKFPVTVTEENSVDNGKETAISAGATVDGIWKTKEIVRTVTGEDMPMQEGKDGKTHPTLVPGDIAGKPAVGLWRWMEGTKGGVAGAEKVNYPKLVAILPEGSKVESLL